MPTGRTRAGRQQETQVRARGNAGGRKCLRGRGQSHLLPPGPATPLPQGLGVGVGAGPAPHWPGLHPGGLCLARGCSARVPGCAPWARSRMWVDDSHGKDLRHGGRVPRRQGQPRPGCSAGTRSFRAGAHGPPPLCPCAPSLWPARSPSGVRTRTSVSLAGPRTGPAQIPVL